MGKFVINIFLNSIVYVEDSELLANNHHYKIISKIKRMNIEKENYIKIKNIIKENNVDGYYHLSTKPFQMKIRYPIGAPYYDSLSINEYKEEVFEEDDDYVIITPDDTCDNGSLILTHKP